MTSKTFVRAIRSAYLCASPKANIPVSVSQQPLVSRSRRSTGEKQLARTYNVHSLPRDDSRLIRNSICREYQISNQSYSVAVILEADTPQVGSGSVMTNINAHAIQTLSLFFIEPPAPRMFCIFRLNLIMIRSILGSSFDVVALALNYSFGDE